MTPEVERSAVHRKEIDAVNKFRRTAKPCTVCPFASPDYTECVMWIRLRKDNIVHIKPVLLYGGALVRMQKDAQIPNLILSGHRSPEHHSRRKIHRFRTRLLVISITKCHVARC